jgi:hypothetical protein
MDADNLVDQQRKQPSGRAYHEKPVITGNDPGRQAKQRTEIHDRDDLPMKVDDTEDVFGCPWQGGVFCCPDHALYDAEWYRVPWFVKAEQHRQVWIH